MKPSSANRWPLVAVLLAVAWLSAAETDDPVGFWQGHLEGAAEAVLKVGVAIERQPDGQLSGQLDIPEQGLVGLPLDLLRFTGRRLRFGHKGTRLLFDGELSADGQTITGTISQSGLQVPLRFRRSRERLALDRPQHPKPPYPYRTEELTIDAPGGVKLSATVTVPAGTGPFPGLVLIHGSGPQDRDETIFGHKPFWVLADALTRRGVAVLRYDKRGVGKSTGPTATVTSLDFAGDAEAALGALLARPEVNRDRVGLLGHSEGGLIAPLIAGRREGVAFVVLLAGPGATGAEVLRHQGSLMQRKLGTPEERVARIDAAYRQVMALVTSTQSAAALAGPLRPLVKELVAAQGGPDRDEVINVAVAQFLLPWLRFFAAYDPVPVLKKVRCPVLALFGELDTQVDPAQNLPPLAAALEAGGNPDYTVVKLPRCNHLFQTARSGLVTEYMALTETMAPRALETIADWVVARTR